MTGETSLRHGPPYEDWPLDFHETLTARFERQARTNPSRKAFGAGIWQPDYAELNGRANAVAHALPRSRSAGGGQIAILMQHDTPQIGMLLAALKAGRTAVVLPTNEPPARLRDLLDNAQAGTILTDESNRTLAADIAGTSRDILDIDIRTAAGPVHNPDVPMSPDDTAVLSYSSGSTGVSKALMRTHRQLLYNAWGQSRIMELTAEDRIALLASLSAGQALVTMWCALANGASLLPFPVKEKGIARLADWMTECGITAYVSTPSLFRHFMKTLDDGAIFPLVHAVKLGAEPATSEDFAAFKRHFPESCIFMHTLGSSEAGNVAALRLTGKDNIAAGRLPVGAAVEGTEILLLGEDGRPVGDGETGEVVVRSRYLSTGYWRNETLTAERFFETARGDGIREFRSGDMGRYNSEGLLELSGRKDARVKIRGYRVEPSEVESALLGLSAVEKAAVYGIEDRQGRGMRLAAAIVLKPGERATAAVLRDGLRAVLPLQMIPSSFVFVDAFPLSAIGKIDREALRRDHPRTSEGAAPIPAKTDTEALLARIWAEAFDFATVGRQDDFFDLGGDSLTAAVVAAKVYDAFGIELNLAAFTEHPVLSEMAASIDELRRGGTVSDAAPLVRVPRDGPLTLSFAQEGTWLTSQTPEASAGYTMAGSYRILGPLDIDVLRDCLTALARRHELLRTTFPPVNGIPRPHIHPAAPVPLPMHDITGAARPDEEARQWHRREAASVFDVANRPLVRFSLLKLRDREHWLLRANHHILSDGWSWNVYFRELALLYEAKLNGRAVPLPEFAPLQYVDYAAWQRHLIRSENPALRKAVAWWRARFANLPPTLELPFKRPKPVAGLDPAEGEIRWGLDPESVRGLNAIRRKAGATYFMSRLAVFAALVAAQTGEPDVILGTFATQRTHLATQDMFGFFANLVTLRLRCDPRTAFRDWLAAVRDVTAETAAYSYMPFKELAWQLQINRVPVPLANALFTTGTAPVGEHFAGLDLQSLDNPPGRMPWGFTFECNEYDEQDRCRTAFDAGLYDPAGVREFIERFRRLAAAAAANPDLPLLRLLEMSGIAWRRPSSGWMRR